MLPGSVLRVVSVAGAIRAEILEDGVRRLRDAGFKVEVDPHTLEKDAKAPFLAGADVVRAHSLQRAFEDPSVGGIICARGGYGAMRILQHLDWSVIRDNPKPLMGFSDITAIHGAMLVHAGLSSWHGPLVSTLRLHKHEADPEGREALEAMQCAFFGTRPEISVELSSLREGEAKGLLLGGNLSLVESLAQGPWFPSLEGAVLFLEEIAEPAYRIDRMLTSLALRGVFARISGLVLGDLGGAGDHYLSAESLDSFVHGRVRELLMGRKIPVAYGGPFGHRARNVALPFGTSAVLRCTDGEAKLVAQSATVMCESPTS